MVQTQEDTESRGARLSVWALWQHEACSQIEPQDTKTDQDGAQSAFPHHSALALTTWNDASYFRLNFLTQ